MAWHGVAWHGMAAKTVNPAPGGTARKAVYRLRWFRSQPGAQQDIKLVRSYEWKGERSR